MGKENKIDAILIAGPTASGKSAVALELAKQCNGLVINADSMQMYRDLSIITARPPVDEELQAPHALYGTVDGAINYSVGHYINEFRQILTEAGEDGLLPIVVGGTGLYFKALLEGLSAVPPVPEQVRAEIRQLAERMGKEALHAHLAVRDPEGARRLNPSDTLRVQRALEVWEATGKPLSEFHAERMPGPLDGRRTVKIFLEPEREALHRIIDMRFNAMMDKGALEEVEVLHGRKLDPMLPVMRAHGVPGLIDYLEGRATLEDAVYRGQADTRRYSKRQFTWFRHQMDDWTWVSPPDAYDRVMAGIDGIGAEKAHTQTLG